MIRFGMVEAGSLHEQNIGLNKNVVNQPLVVGNAEFFCINLREEIKRAAGVDTRQSGNGGHRSVADVPLNLQAAALFCQVVNALIAAQRCLHGKLPGNVAAKTHIGDDFQPFNVIGRLFPIAGEHHPPDAEPGRPIRFRKSVKRNRQNRRRERRRRNVNGSVVQNFFVNFVGKQNQIVFFRQPDNLCQNFGGINGAGRVIRINDDDIFE